MGLDLGKSSTSVTKIVKVSRTVLFCLSSNLAVALPATNVPLPAIVRASDAPKVDPKLQVPGGRLPEAAPQLSRTPPAARDAEP